jgi:lipopolysaccharide biosynthesis regulator YciM
VIDLRSLLPVLDRINFSGWLMAELDQAKRPAREAARLSRDYIVSTLGLPLGPAGQEKSMDGRIADTQPSPGTTSPRRRPVTR